MDTKRIIRSRLIAGIIGTALVAGLGCSATQGAGAATAPNCGTKVAKSNGQPWTCTFDDEFNGNSLNTNYWTAQTTAASDYTTGPKSERACYEAADVTVSGGYLHLGANRVAPFTCHTPSSSFTTNLTAGMVTSVGKFDQTYGRFEARAMLPATSVRGLQETLWLWPSNQFKYGPVWPMSGEIDYSEFYSQYANLDVPYLHYAESGQAVTADDCHITVGAFNTYDLTWQPGELTIAVNGHTCLDDHYHATNAPSPAPFNQPFFLALTQAIGVGTNVVSSATPFPAQTLVDYVRVWK